MSTAFAPATVYEIGAADSGAIPRTVPPAYSSDGSWNPLADSGNVVALAVDIPVDIPVDVDAGAAWPRIPDERSNRRRLSRRWRSDDGVPS
mmetsp:Transcript_23772/g.49631  ORF Transcript_23772/g.49631 Transcript_23772/m.49631 type:complete len:91 (-) Transcript_23772:82-354(-)